MERKHVAILPIIIAVIAIIYQLVSAPKAVNPETGSVHRVGMSPQQEQRLGLQAYQQVLQQEGANVVNSGADYERVKAIARRLASAADERSQIKYDWKLSLVRSDQVNAFCLPGGEIVVYTAILPVAKNDSGLATVMGHEMGHAVARHSAQRMLRQNLAQTALMGAQGSLYDMDYQQRQSVMAALGMGAQYGYIMPFSREQESEADHMGLLYMARAGYNPRESLEFWKRMESQGGGRQPPQFLSDHPSHGTRIQQLDAWMPEAEKEYANSRMKDTKAPTQSTGM
jgi:predicted Zn-dependent protease